MAERTGSVVKRSQVLFVAVVGAILFTAWLAERSRSVDPQDAFVPVRPGAVIFDPLVPPFGEHELRGVVLTPGGVPSPEVQVSLLAAGEPTPGAEPLTWSFTDAAGRFELFDLRPGTYRAVLVQPGHPPTTREVSVPHEGQLVLELERPLDPVVSLPDLHRTRLSGLVRAPEGLGVGSLEDWEVVLRPTTDNAPLSGAVVRRVPTDARGAWEVLDLVVARYEVEVLPPWARTGSYPVLGRARLTPVGRALPRRLDLLLEAGGLAGTLVDHRGKPLEGALVKVWREDESEARSWPPVATDTRGAFAFRDLSPGAYLIRARAGGSESEARVRIRRGELVPIELPPLDTRRSDG